MAKERTIHSDLAIPPGEYLEEVLCELRLSQEVLAKRLDVSSTELDKILTGEQPITPAMSLQFEKILGVPSHIWTGLEKEYRVVVPRGQAQ